MMIYEKKRDNSELKLTLHKIEFPPDIQLWCRFVTTR